MNSTAVDTIAPVNKGKAGLFLKFRVVELYFCIEFAQLSIIKWIIQRETHEMNTAQTVQLIGLLSKKRTESGLSVAELARRGDLPVSVVWKIEQGMIASPRAESLIAIGDVLGIPSIDLFTIVGWVRANELPSIGPYLRAKYADLPEETSLEVEKRVTTSIPNKETPANEREP